MKFINKKKFIFIIVFIFIFSCGKKEEVKPEEKIIPQEKPSVELIEKKEIYRKKNYSNIYFFHFLTFLSNKYLYSNFQILNPNQIYVFALSNEFELNVLSRKKTLETAISNYIELMKTLSNTEEINFINQRIGICKYKNGEFKEAYKTLSDVYFSNEKEKIDNEELKFYLALSLLAFKKDTVTTYQILSSLQPHISTLSPMGYYYLLAKISLWADKTNEAKIYLEKAIYKDKDLFTKKYKEDALIFFKDETFRELNFLKSPAKNNNRKEEIFRINFNLSLLYNEIKNLNWFYEMPPIVSRPSIPRFRDIITNSIVLKNKYYCFYEDAYFKDEKIFNLFVCGIPIYQRVSNKMSGIKYGYFVSEPLLLLVNVQTNLTITNIFESNSILTLTNETPLINSTRINIPSKFFWKIEKIEANNDEYWDYLLIGINATNEIVISIFDVNKETFLKVTTNNIEQANFSILIHQNPSNQNQKVLTIIDKKEKNYNLNIK